MENGAIVVSGGASGLGQAVAKHFAERGADVATVDLKLPAESDGLRGFVCDVTDASAVAETIAEISKVFGGIGCLVTCAGIAPGAKDVGRDGPHDPDLFRKVLEVNTVGTFNLLAECAAHMKENAPDEKGQRGLIVTTASVAAYEGQIGQIAYSASKGAVAAMTLPAARELARDGIRVVSIAPGVFDTPMLQGLPEEVRTSIAATIPFPPRLGAPEDFAALVGHVYDNVTINGEVIRIDGALRMAAK